MLLFIMNVLYLLSAPNIYGGTPKKILDLVKHTSNQCAVYFWSASNKNEQALFIEAGAKTYTGAYGRNLLRHVRSIIQIIDKHSIDIIQTQFSFGEVLGFFAKLLRPKVKLIVSFVAPFSPPSVKSAFLRMLYNRVNAFIYVSNYVKKEKIASFPMLRKKAGVVIYNGTNQLPYSKISSPLNRRYRILAVSGLVDWKNIATLIRATAIIVHDMGYINIELTVIGDGPERTKLLRLISYLRLENHVNLIGYRNDVGDFLYQCDLFAHPSVAEGFGIAVIEAMMAEKPVIAANAGALPELIVDGEAGLLVAPFDVEKWAKSIMLLIENPLHAKQLAVNGNNRAMHMFHVERFVSDHEKMYKDVVKGRFI